MSPLSTYTIIVIDYSTGRCFTTTISKPVEDDFEEYVYNKLEALGFRMKECEWMEFQGELEHLEV